ADGFVEVIRQHFPGVELIAGTATAGIPHAAWVAQKLQLPMVYVRDKAKGHGKENMIEGLIRPGQKAVVIEDLISTGGSSLKAAAAIDGAGAETLGVAAIFTYELEKANQAFRDQNIALHTITDFSTLIESAVRLGKIAPSDVALLQSWRMNPAEF